MPCQAKLCLSKPSAVHSTIRLHPARLVRHPPPSPFSLVCVVPYCTVSPLLSTLLRRDVHQRPRKGEGGGLVQCRCLSRARSAPPRPITPYRFFLATCVSLAHAVPCCCCVRSLPYAGSQRGSLSSAPPSPPLAADLPTRACDAVLCCAIRVPPTTRHPPIKRCTASEAQALPRTGACRRCCRSHAALSLAVHDHPASLSLIRPHPGGPIASQLPVPQ